MDLKELKTEIRELPKISESIEQFQKSWVKPIKTNTNRHLPFLQSLPKKTKDELNEKLSEAQKLLNELKFSRIIGEKMNLYSSSLIELKLTTITGNTSKSKYITEQLLNDESLKLQDTIRDVKFFEDTVIDLTSQYHEINELLQKKLRLEDFLTLTELPHKKHLNNLRTLSKKQKELIGELGKHFVSLARETQLKNER